MSAGRRSIAVVLDGPPTPAWQARSLAGLAESPLLELSATRFAGPPRRGALRRLSATLERHAFKLGADALAPVSLDEPASFLQGSLPSHSLVVWLSEHSVAEDTAPAVLQLRHGGVAEPADDAFCRALLEGRSVLESELVLGVDGAAVVVARTVSEVRAFSATLSRDLALWKLAATVRRAAERAPGLNLPAPGPKPRKAPPRGGPLIARTALAWPRVVGTRVLFRRPWRVRVRSRAERATDDWRAVPELVRWRAGHVYADPFLFEHEGRHHLFCEEVPRGSVRGVISHTELLRDRTLAAPPRPVLEQPYHLSYPFVFAHGAELLMIPETSAAARVELYRALEFPVRWQREQILLDAIDAADATVLAHGDRLWLFVGVAAADASSLDELHLFWAAQPRGPWLAHAANPVVSDVRAARPAGAIQRWGGRLVRPAQDGSRRYGGAVSFREIDVLSTSEYAEHEIARIDPSSAGGRATHTYTADSRFEAIDVRRRELRRGLPLRGR